MAIEMIESFDMGTQIKVIGVGGGGGNAVDHMIAEEQVVQMFIDHIMNPTQSLGLTAFLKHTIFFTLIFKCLNDIP